MSEKLTAPGGSELPGASLRFNDSALQQPEERGEMSGDDPRVPLGSMRTVDLSVI